MNSIRYENLINVLKNEMDKLAQFLYSHEVFAYYTTDDLFSEDIIEATTGSEYEGIDDVMSYADFTKLVREINAIHLANLDGGELTFRGTFG